MNRDEERQKIIDECATIKRMSDPPMDDDTEVNRTSLDLRTVVEAVLAKKFAGRYIRAVDVPEVQKFVRAAVKKRFPAVVVNLKPSRGGGFEISVEGF